MPGCVSTQTTASRSRRLCWCYVVVVVGWFDCQPATCVLFALLRAPDGGDGGGAKGRRCKRDRANVWQRARARIWRLRPQLQQQQKSRKGPRVYLWPLPARNTMDAPRWLGKTGSLLSRWRALRQSLCGALRAQRSQASLTAGARRAKVTKTTNVALTFARITLEGLRASISRHCINMAR